MRVDVTRVVKCRKGLIAVIMLILLVISILFALIAVLYAINMTGGGGPIENLKIPIGRAHVWHNETGDWWEAGFMVINTGDTDVSFYRITVGSYTCMHSNVYYWRTGTVEVTQDLSVTSSPLSGTSCNITVQGELRTFTQASGDLMLKSGRTVILYVNIPSFEQPIDALTTITVYTNLRPYSQEADVK